MLFPGRQYSFNFFSQSEDINSEYNNPSGFCVLEVCKQILNAYNNISKEVELISLSPSSSNNFGFIVLLNSSSLEKSKNSFLVISGTFVKLLNKFFVNEEYFAYSLLSAT